MTTLAEHIIVTGAKNHPPMLEKSMYDSWASHIRLLVYPTVEENEEAKDIWNRVKMLMKGIELSYQERECRLYNLFDMFAYVQGETLYPDPIAFVANFQTLYNPSQSPQHSGSLVYSPPQKFTPVYAAPIHHQHHHNPVSPQQNLISPLPFISPTMTPQPQAEFLQLDFSLVVPMFQQREDTIKCINKAMTFLSIVASRFPPLNNQLRTSSNPINQATIQDGRTIPQNSSFQTDDLDAYDSDCDDLSSAKAVLMANFSSCDPEVLSEETGQISDKEKLAFLADTDCDDLSSAKAVLMAKFLSCDLEVLSETIPQNSSFQTDDLDAYDSDCDDLSSAKAVLMANFSSCDPEVLSEVPYFHSYLNDMIN
nr:hypothetical protein [Tanacetum cinerariifolium]